MSTLQLFVVLPLEILFGFALYLCILASIDDWLTRETYADEPHEEPTDWLYLDLKSEAVLSPDASAESSE